ncbi:hypothetical protein V8G54_016052 [Vigna mungo]|uniref:tRNA/rRNA methyltransferase SpoU type domain-containing protein n=1 Tax=Vigna mungo TaxID=3915 RepID=A0AAQ3RYZ3_VIGMU
MGCESYVVVHNIAKRHNVGTLARSATAFGVSELILVGRRDFNCFGSHGSSSHLRFRHFHSLHDARNFLKDKGCDICGGQVWAGFEERSRDGNKFVVAERPVKQGRRNYCTETEDSIIEERKARRESAANGFFDEAESGNSSSNLLDALFVDG